MKIKQIIVTNIDWDIEEPTELPKEVVVNIDEDNVNLLEDVCGYADDVVNYISDKYGYCICGCNIEIK